MALVATQQETEGADDRHTSATADPIPEEAEAAARLRDATDARGDGNDIWAKRREFDSHGYLRKKCSSTSPDDVLSRFALPIESFVGNSLLQTGKHPVKLQLGVRFNSLPGAW